MSDLPAPTSTYHQISTQESIQKEFPGTQLLTASSDASKLAEVKAAFDKIRKIHVLVNNAGVLGRISPIKDANIDEWFSGIETSLKSSFTVAWAFPEPCC
ncbi:hypothetical protein K504DRAFT_506606 [Pleomassaria siparia CBS 279.74]|uniref:NAD(P)-binding protein n=1 Tax=Pleomassaria siparia CBS 279.74 TaxID=1314801 RepID=A0A6G1JXD0_9PLEO|nr:hypothetical protein K504DRAFT_506606 [Pleomassaria siparia CBS 279.74]